MMKLLVDYINWNWECISNFYHTLYWAYDYFSMPRLKLIYVSKGAPVNTCVAVEK